MILLLSCTEESIDDELTIENDTENNIDNIEDKITECTGDTSDINETYFLFDIDQPYKYNRLIEEGDDRGNKFIHHEGNYIFTGTFNETYRYEKDGNLALYSLNEELELNWMFPKTKGEFYDVIHTSDNHYVAVGRKGDKDISEIYVVKINLNGELIWEYKVDSIEEINFGAFATTIIENPIQNGYLIFGKTKFNSNLFEFGDKSFILNLNSQGEQTWVKSLNNTAEPTDVILANNGNLLVLQNDVDIRISEMSPDGEIINSNSFGSSDTDKGNHVLELKNGNYLITGTTWGDDLDVSDNTGNSDAWLLTIDSNLNLIQEQTLGGWGYQSGVKTVERSDGTYFMYGNTSNSDFIVDPGWNQEWYLELSSDFCILNWYKGGLYSDKRARDMIYFENENRIARFYETNSAIYSNNPQEFYDQRIVWIHFKED